MIDNVSGTTGGVACDGTPTGTVTVIDASGKRSQQSPCFDFPILGDELNAAGISWKYYIEGGTGALAVIRQVRNSPMWTQNQGTTALFLHESRPGQLPAVSWVIARYEQSEHPPNSICAGDNQTGQYVDAIMPGPAWNSTVDFCDL